MIPQEQNDRTYVILDSSDLDTVNFSLVEETSASTIRYNLDSTKFIVKYAGSQPVFLTGKQTYTHSEIKAIVSDTSNGWEESE